MLEPGLGRNPNQRQLGEGLQREALPGESIAELGEGLRRRSRLLRPQQVAESADRDLAADVALAPAIGEAGIEAEGAEASPA